MDTNLLAFLLGLGTNLSYDGLRVVWNKAVQFLTPKAQETAKLIGQGNQDDTSPNQQKALQAEFKEIMQKPELQELLKNIGAELLNSGNENVIIQNSTVNQKSKDGDNIIGNVKK